MSIYEDSLIEAFHDTVKAFTKYQDLIDDTQRMVDDTRVYFEGFSQINKPIKRRRTIINVTPDTTFHQASKYLGSGGKIAVLNFANAYNLRGVEEGVMAQEECLLRSSNLYASLTCKYVLTNYYDRNNRNRSRFGSDTVVYSKDVTVFKSDDSIPVKLEKPFKVDVITSAAPYFSKNYGAYDYGLYESVYYGRIKNVLEVAIANDVDVLILGAFGCGAFHNPPELVAGVFKHLLVDKGYCHCFKTVTFAVKPDNNKNYEMFKDILETGQHHVVNDFKAEENIEEEESEEE